MFCKFYANYSFNIIIYVKNLLDTKIHNKEDLVNEIKNITVLGEIPSVKEGFNKDGVLLIQKNDKNIESICFKGTLSSQ